MDRPRVRDSHSSQTFGIGYRQGMRHLQCNVKVKGSKKGARASVGMTDSE